MEGVGSGQLPGLVTKSNLLRPSAFLEKTGGLTISPSVDDAIRNGCSDPVSKALDAHSSIKSWVPSLAPTGCGNELLQG